MSTIQNTDEETQADAILPRRVIWTYATLALPLAIIGYPLNIWMPAHYAGTLGVPLAALGVFIMVARLSDVITDPLIGELSDRTRSRFGRRKPYIMIGVPTMMLGSWFLFVPAEGVGMIYFLFWLTLFFIGSTLIQLPHSAWGAEISPDYHQRSRVTATREFYVLAGLMLAAAVPFVIEIMVTRNLGLIEVFQFAGHRIIGWLPWTDPVAMAPVEKLSRAELTGPVLKGLAWLIVILLPIGALAALTIAEPKASPTQRNVPIKEGMGHLWRNGPMKRILIIMLLVYFGESFRNAVSLFFIRDIIGASIGGAYFMYFTAGIVAIPFWLWLGRKIGKHRAFMWTLITVSTVSFANFFLRYGDEGLFLFLFFIKGFCFGGLQFLPLAMLADAVDVDSMRSGGKRAGTYFAMSGMMTKLAIAFGTGSSLIVIGLLGFDAATGLEGSSEIGVLALRGSYTMLPVLFYGIAMRFIWSYPLTSTRHQRLRERMARRNLRLKPNADLAASQPPVQS